MLCCGVELLFLGGSKNAVLCSEVQVKCVLCCVDDVVVIFYLTIQWREDSQVSGGCIVIFIIFM